jgi:hypothetical protein
MKTVSIKIKKIKLFKIKFRFNLMIYKILSSSFTVATSALGGGYLTFILNDLYKKRFTNSIYSKRELMFSREISYTYQLINSGFFAGMAIGLGYTFFESKLFEQLLILSNFTAFFKLVHII